MFIMDKITPSLTGQLNKDGLAYGNAKNIENANPAHPGSGNRKLKNPETILSIEDTNISHTLYKNINNDPSMFVFDATIFKPLIKYTELRFLH